jgi:hypothetical protein
MPPRGKATNEPKKPLRVATTLLYVIGFVCFLHVVFVGPPKTNTTSGGSEDANVSGSGKPDLEQLFNDDQIEEPMEDQLRDQIKERLEQTKDNRRNITTFSTAPATQPAKKIDLNATCPEKKEEKSIYRKEFEKHYPVEEPYDRNQDFDSIPCSNIPKNCDLTDTRWGNPFLMISYGRSGTTSTWDIIAGLTGEYIPGASEDMGRDKGESVQFFARQNKTEHGKCWLHRLLCDKLAIVKRAKKKGLGRASIYGSKWKPWHLGFNTTLSREALQWLGTQPQIKVVHNTRNMVDMYISKHKHQVLDKLLGKNRQAHCYDDRDIRLSKESWAKLIDMGIPRDTPCAQIFKEIERRTATQIPQMLAYFEKNVLQTDYVSEMLDFYNVSRVTVTYEKLYFTDNAEEWLRIFRYLGFGPQQNLTLEEVFAKTTFQKTSANDRSKRMSNYDEVVDALRCTRYAKYLD